MILGRYRNLHTYNAMRAAASGALGGSTGVRSTGATYVLAFCLCQVNEFLPEQPARAKKPKHKAGLR